MRMAADRGDKGAETAELAGGLLITGSHAGERTTVEALRLADGLPVWWYDSRLRLNDLVCHDGTVFIVSSGRPRSGSSSPAAVVALRAEDGAKLWHVGPKQVPRMVLRRVAWGLQTLWQTSSPTTAWEAARSPKFAGNAYLSTGNDTVFACVNSVIFALDARTGALLWVSPVPRSPHVAYPSRRLITAHGDVVYVHGANSGIDALDARTGKVRWRSSNVILDRKEVTVSERYVHVSRIHGRPRAITALRVADGKREQPLPLADGEFPAEVTSDDIAYVMRDTRLRAVRIAGGEELWQSAPLRDVPDNERESFDHSVCVAASEQIVIYGYEHLRATVHWSVVGGLDARSGARLWEWREPEQSTPRSSWPRLNVAGGNVYAITSRGIYALSGEDGRLIWQAPGEGGIAHTALALDGSKFR